MAFLELFGDKLLSKDGEVATADVVGGKKTVMIYFSAHWCPPCRGFTPQLATAYKESAVAGKDVIIVFASSDKDEAAFNEYYGEMPWHALPYASRDAKENLSTKFGVQGIPTLVILDGEGKEVTREGRATYKDYLGGGAAPAPVAAPAAGPATGDQAKAFIDLFGEKLLGKDGEVATPDLVGGKKHIMVYFSAHWCPPCRGFTPELAKAYKGSPAAGKDVLIIFASSDKDEAAFNDYYGEMPWHAIPFANRNAKESLSEKFGVQGIPTLVILDGQGNEVTREGRGEYKKYLGGAGAGVSEGPCCTIS